MYFPRFWKEENRKKSRTGLSAFWLQQNRDSRQIFFVFRVIKEFFLTNNTNRDEMLLCNTEVNNLADLNDDLYQIKVFSFLPKSCQVILRHRIEIGNSQATYSTDLSSSDYQCFCLCNTLRLFSNFDNPKRSEKFWNDLSYQNWNHYILWWNTWRSKMRRWRKGIIEQVSNSFPFVAFMFTTYALRKSLKKLFLFPSPQP